MCSAAQNSAINTPADLFGPRIAAPEGFNYSPGLLSPEQERDFVNQFRALPLKPFEFHGHLGNRRIVSYGDRYDYGSEALRPSEPMPDS